MPDTQKKTWTPPELVQFDSPDDVWDYYKDRATPLELARLALLLEQSRKIIRERKSLQKRRA